MSKRKPRQPWIKVMNLDGEIVQRCKDPRKAAAHFIHYKNFNFREKGHRLFLDNKEYNPPIQYASLFEFDTFAEVNHKVYEDLKYLIDIHIAFYY